MLCVVYCDVAAGGHGHPQHAESGLCGFIFFFPSPFFLLSLSFLSPFPLLSFSLTNLLSRQVCKKVSHDHSVDEKTRQLRLQGLLLLGDILVLHGGSSRDGLNDLKSRMGAQMGGAGAGAGAGAQAKEDKEQEAQWNGGGGGGAEKEEAAPQAKKQAKESVSSKQREEDLD